MDLVMYFIAISDQMKQKNVIRKSVSILKNFCNISGVSFLKVAEKTSWIRMMCRKNLI